MKPTQRARTGPPRTGRGAVLLDEPAQPGPGPAGAVLLEPELPEPVLPAAPAAPTAVRATGSEVRAGLERALEHADHLDELDDAAVELARRLADDLDDQALDGKRLAPVARALLEVLERLHLTAASRGDAANVDEHQEVSPVASIRNRSRDRLEALTG